MRGLVTHFSALCSCLQRAAESDVASLGRDLLPLCGRAVARRAEDVFRLRKRLIKFSAMRLCDCIVVSPLVKLGDGEKAYCRPTQADRDNEFLKLAVLEH